jgi:Kdo2-lipid IVA lauroyltransferase/acyltransferase
VLGKLSSLLIIGVLRIIGLMPFFLLQCLSYIIFFILYYFPGYRKDVVWINMLYALNDLPGKILYASRRKFYWHLSELILEVIKGMYLTKKEMHERMTLTEDSRILLKNYQSDQKNIVMLMGHYGNWEWASMMALQYCPLPYFSFYAPLSNPYLDEYIKEKRTRWGAVFLPPKSLSIGLEQMKGNTCQIGLVADQSPTGRKNIIQTRFLGLDTSFFTGPETISKSLNAAVIYVSLQKTGFGRYTIQMIPICDNASDMGENEIIQSYAGHLEKDILQHPEWWIWSHKRWKGQIPY